MQPSYRDIWKIVYPILISLMMETLIGVTDTAFLGRVGEVELGASALAGVYYMAVFMIGFGFSIGAQILIARRNGEKAYTQIGPLMQHGMLFLLLLAGVMFWVSRSVTPLLLRAIISSDAVYEAAVCYTDWRVYGFFFSFVAIMFRAFYVGITHTRMLTANSILMLSVNVVFNYVLIFGKCGFPAMGIAGAAIASALAEMVSALYFVIYSVWVIDHRRYALFRRCRLHLSLLGRILKTSIWTMIQSCVSVTSWFLFFVAVEHLGEHSLAITNIVRSISGILFMGISAYASTASTLTGNLIGARNLRSVLPTAWRVIRMSYTIVLPVVVVFALFPELLLRIYTDDPSLIADTLPSLWVMLSSYVVTIPANILFSTVSGTGNTRSALWLELQALGFYILYVAYVVEWLRADVAICWSAEWVYNGLLGVVCYRYLMRSKWFTKRI